VVNYAVIDIIPDWQKQSNIEQKITSTQSSDGERFGEIRPNRPNFPHKDSTGNEKFLVPTAAAPAASVVAVKPVFEVTGCERRLLPSALCIIKDCLPTSMILIGMFTYFYVTNSKMVRQ